MSPYAAFFAYRVLEDLAFAFGDDLTPETWDQFNNALGASEAQWRDLTRWGKDARHRGRSLVLSNDERLHLLEIAADAIGRMLVHVGNTDRATISRRMSGTTP